MSVEERNQINYVVVCVNEFANRYRLSVKEAFQYLFDYKGIQFLKEYYDIEHTLALEDAIDDLVMICNNNGGVLS